MRWIKKLILAHKELIELGWTRHEFLLRRIFVTCILHTFDPAIKTQFLLVCPVKGKGMEYWQVSIFTIHLWHKYPKTNALNMDIGMHVGEGVKQHGARKVQEGQRTNYVMAQSY